MQHNACRTLRTILATAALLLIPVCAFSADTYTVRRGDTLYKIACKYGTTVPILQRINQLRSPHRIKAGQVLTLPTNDLPKPGESTTYGIAKEDGLEVWTEDTLIATLKKGDRFLILERIEDKFKAKLNDDKIGWVIVEKVEIDETRKPLPPTEIYPAGRSSVVNTALAYRGARYRRGGTGRRGFDCSGLVMHVYSKHGVKLPHSARSQFKHGIPISKSNLQPGDLVFFKNTYRRGISHVGIYIGDGKFVHAAARKRGVRVDLLENDYYRRKYAGARRI